MLYYPSTNHLIAILVASVANMGVGALWYSPALFGKAWFNLQFKGTGKTMEEIKKNAGVGYFGSFVASLIMACILRNIILFTGYMTLEAGARMGLYLGIGFVATTMLADALFSGKPVKLYGITAGYHLVSLMIMGALVTLWP